MDDPSLSRFKNRFGLLLVTAAELIGAFVLVRVVLAILYRSEMRGAMGGLLWGAVWVGARMDFLVAAALTLPLAFLAALLPDRFWTRRATAVAAWLLLAGLLYVFVFTNAADIAFFDEFNARLNYVAVDYLFATPGEVIDNIRQSYPLPLLLVLIGGGTLLLLEPLRRLGRRWLSVPVPPRRRWSYVGVWLAVALALGAVTDARLFSFHLNRVVDEISANGFYTFAYAAITNNMDYDSQYLTEDPATAEARLRTLVAEPGVAFTDGAANPIERRVPARAGLGPVNVVIILEESLGSKFVGALGRKDTLTPNVDRLSKEGVFFRRFYSTGTRTVRALEAVLTSFPPIPGTSIVKRNHSDGVACLARKLRERGYQTMFVYGGRGLFDNMRHFALANGFDRFVEQKHYAHPTFTTAWGVCDEDIFAKATEEFDALQKTGKPFFATVLTVSNHKPYTYPKGRIDLDPAQHSRDHAVKYADYALGKFFDEARSHPFYTNTIFAVLGDHGARVYGADFIPIDSYEIPLLLIAPGRLAPRIVDVPGSSMDLAPTLLGLLGFDYTSVFFGRDLLSFPHDEPRLLVQHDRDVGYFDGSEIAILSSRRFSGAFAYDRPTNHFTAILPPGPRENGFIADAVAFYQTAYRIYAQGHFHASPKQPLRVTLAAGPRTADASTRPPDAADPRQR